MSVPGCQPVPVPVVPVKIQVLTHLGGTGTGTGTGLTGPARTGTGTDRCRGPIRANNQYWDGRLLRAAGRLCSLVLGHLPCSVVLQPHSSEQFCDIRPKTMHTNVHTLSPEDNCRNSRMQTVRCSSTSTGAVLVLVPYWYWCRTGTGTSWPHLGLVPVLVNAMSLILVPVPILTASG